MSGTLRLGRGWTAVAAVACALFVAGAASGHAFAQQGSGLTTQKPSAEARAQRRQAAGNLVGHGGPVKAIAVDAASGTVLTGSFDYAMMFWRVKRGQDSKSFARLDFHGGAVNAVTFALTKTFGADAWYSTSDDIFQGPRVAAAAGDDMIVSVWDLKKQTRIDTYEGHTG